MIATNTKALYKIGALFSLIFLCSFLHARGQSADAITGIWLSADKDAKVEIYKSGTRYNGKIAWIKNVNEADGTPRRDKYNPDTKLRQRRIAGLEILTGFSYNDGEWTGGKIYDPKSGKTYSSKMKLKGNRLDIRGYVGAPLFGRTTEWTRSNL